MSSEDLPLIFEPFDDVTPEGAGVATAVLAPGNSQLSVSMSTTGTLLSEVEFDQVGTGDTGPSRVPPLVLPDWTSPWQTSGAEISEPICPSGPPIDPPPSETEQPGGSETIQNPEETPPTSEPNPTSIASQQITMTTVTKTTNLPVVKSGLEELESEEEPEVDEEDENTEESEDSEEEQKETPIPAPTQPPYSLIPPPSVWVQRNQGLMRSWVELIREKAGYVSGMLAPVGIGIMGALLIVGALYSIRMIHRKRRNSFKHQRRRKARHTEQPREPSSNGQDQAMLLADSSEDEF
ncbi:unnamed protein product [Oncorhynchus mykiss]|nr:unnamed protein product [Oncorhynchus mykiss]